MSSSTETKGLAVFCHIYFEDGLELLWPHLKSIQSFTSVFYFSISIGNPQRENIHQKIQHHFPNSFTLYCPNKGKDIGGKLLLLDAYIQGKEKHEFGLFLHDKKSQHLNEGDIWRKKLLSICEPDKLNAILHHPDETIGCWAHPEFIASEWKENEQKFDTTNHSLLIELKNKFQFSNEHFSFIGGAIFVARLNPILDFFSSHPPLTFFPLLEKGNVMDHFNGTYTHTFERLFGWIIHEHKLKTVSI